MTTATVVRPEPSVGDHDSPFVSRTNTPEQCTLVLFGATGDLAGRKLLPALAGLLKARYLPPQFAIVGIGRRDKTDDSFRADVQKDIAEFRPQDAPEATAA